jgi:hypothetical protein
MKLLIMQFSPTSCHFIFFGPNILFNTLFSNTLSLCSSLNVRDQVTHPYKTRGKNIVLYIPIFTLWAADEKTEESEQNGGEHYPNSLPV